MDWIGHLKPDPKARFDRAKALYDAYPLTIPYNTRRHSMATLSIAFGDGNFDRRIARILRPVIEQMFEREGYFNPEEPYYHDNGLDLDFLYREQEEHLQHLTDHIMPATESLAPFLGYIARFLKSGTGTHVPLIELLDWRRVILNITRMLREEPLFPKHSTILTNNILRVSSVTAETLTPKTKIIMPTDYQGTPAQAVHAYLQGTPFEDLLMTSVPFTIDDEVRFSHAWVLGSCLRGDTKIYDPMSDTTETIAARCERGVAFHVFSLDTNTGELVIAKANAPTRFTRQPMIQLSDGTRHIVVTAKHRVWNGRRYVSVDRLLSSRRIHLPTISDNALSRLRQDARRYSQTGADCLDGYRSSFHLRGLQPHAATDSGRVFSPSQDGVLEQSSFSCHGRQGVLDDRPAHTRQHQADGRLSMRGFALLWSSTLSRVLRCRSALGTLIPSYTLSLPLGIFHRLTRLFYIGAGYSQPTLATKGLCYQYHVNQRHEYKRLLSPSCIRPQELLFYNRNQVCDPSKYQQSAFPLVFLSYTDTTTWTVLQASDAVYYDFHVPIYNNYLAEGLIHHNSGAGKSTLLERQFLDDIERPDKPAIIVIDPKGTMIDRLSRLAVFHPEHGRHRDRLVILDPQRDPPALNLFDPFTKRFHLYSNEVKRQVENTTIGLFEYIFASNDMPLTPKQGTCFSMCARLLYSMSGSTMETFLDLLQDTRTFDESPFKQHILRQPPIVQRFFREAFYHKSEYGETKRQIANRIYDMLASQQFAAMFMAKRRKFDAFDCLQQGKIVLVSSPIASLGVDGSTMFSRTICSMILSAAFERIAHPKHTWRPAFLMIDEAQVVMDEVVTQRLLQMAREFRVGVTHAHQQIKGQLSEALFSTLSANTAIKYCATRSYDDAQKMARDMGQCDPSFILGQKVHDGHAHFACHVDGKTSHPVSIAVPIGGISKQPQMTRDEHERLLERNRLLVAAEDEPMPSFSPAPETHNAPAEDKGASRVPVSQPAEADTPSIPDDDDGCTW